MISKIAFLAALPNHWRREIGMTLMMVAGTDMRKVLAMNLACDNADGMTDEGMDVVIGVAATPE